MLGGQPITMKSGKATLRGTDTLAGSSISVLDAVRNVVRFGLPLADAVYAATTAPALAAHLNDVGAIQTGKKADLVLLGQDLSLQAVFVDGVKQGK
jgi:N-acetylglucosamine-6-phosphate deacetylase